METINKEKFSMIIEFVTKQFTDACYEEGLSVEHTQRLLYSKEGLETIKNAVKKYL